MTRIRVRSASGPESKQFSKIDLPTYASTAESGSSRRTMSASE